MNKKNAIYAQSGGVTSVINATAAGVIETALRSNKINKIYAAKNGILGVLREELFDISKENLKEINKLIYTPGGAFGSCRYKLKEFKDQENEYSRLVEIFKKHNIGYFFYNGGGDSQDTANKISEITAQMGWFVQCIGIPKTVDNDLAYTDNSPGFGSVAKYVAISTIEAGLDVASMAETSTKVFILEVMGRHAGWIAASSGLASQLKGDPPHLIIFPEIPFRKSTFLKAVKKTVNKEGYCVIVTSEGAQYKNGKFLAEAETKDAFGHKQLGGVAPFLANLIKDSLGYKFHWAVADYLQRSARHIASIVDLEQAYSVGKYAVKYAENGDSGVMPIIVRGKGKKYTWKISKAPLNKIANKEKKLPKKYITKDGFNITKACREYLLPLIQGEAYPKYKQGIPVRARLKKILIKKELPNFKI
jgi:6-phosphofructokinase 1